MQFGILPTQQQQMQGMNMQGMGMSMQGNNQQQQKGKLFHDFYKTKMCPDFTTLGTCAKGANCTFAHDASEMRDKPNLQKTKLCENFLKGFCNNPSCVFAHGEDELRSTNDLYKTALCYNYNQGKCQNGERCRYAHGYEELRPMPYYLTKKKQQQQEMNIFDLGGQIQGPQQFNFMAPGANQFMPILPPPPQVAMPYPPQEANQMDFVMRQQQQQLIDSISNLESINAQNQLFNPEKMNFYGNSFK